MQDEIRAREQKSRKKMEEERQKQIQRERINQREAEQLKKRQIQRRQREKEIRDRQMQNHFDNQFSQENRGQGNRQQFMQQIRDTTPHNFIQKTDSDMYGQANGYQYNQYQKQQPQFQNHKPFQNYGVSANDRPPVVSQGGCCCSIM